MNYEFNRATNKIRIKQLGGRNNEQSFEDSDRGMVTIAVDYEILHKLFSFLEPEQDQDLLPI